MLLEVSIYSVIVSDVPDFGVAVNTTTNVIIDNVHDFVSNEEFNFFRLEHHDKTTVVIQLKTVSSSSSQPIISIDKLETGSKVTEEGVLEQQTDTSSNQPLTSVMVNTRVSRTNEIFKLLAT